MVQTSSNSEDSTPFERPVVDTQLENKDEDLFDSIDKTPWMAFDSLAYHVLIMLFVTEVSF